MQKADTNDKLTRQNLMIQQKMFINNQIPKQCS